MAAFGDTPAALLPAFAAMGFLGGLSSYSFYLIGKICAETNSFSIAEAWEKTVGGNSSWLITMACLLTPLGAALSYSIILADTFTALARTASLPITRSAAIVSTSTFILYPLCRLKSLASLAPMSIMGVLGIITTCVFMAARAVGSSYAPGKSCFSLASCAMLL